LVARLLLRAQERLTLVAACLFVAVVVGCGRERNAGPASGGGTAPTSSPATAPVASSSPAAAAGTTSQASTVQAPAVEPAEPSGPAEPAEPATEANWTLEVSDTRTTEVNGYDLTSTLSIMAIKLGGRDELGTYRGLVTFDYTYDMQRGSVSGKAAGAGQEVDAIIEVVRYDREALDAAGSGALSDLAELDAMAIGKLILTGRGTANEQAGGASWGTADGGTVQVPYRLTVDGGQVRITLDGVAPGATFSGTITGTPI
jgi:hypothetical protein